MSMPSSAFVPSCSRRRMSGPAAAVAWLLLAAGVSTLIALPELRGYHPQLGWMPLWLALAPLCCLVVPRRTARP